MTNVFVMQLYKIEDNCWQQSGLVINTPFTEQEWLEKVVGARDFFLDIGGSETYPDEHTIDYIDATNRGRIIYQLQDPDERRAKIDQAVTNALASFTIDILREILGDNYRADRFSWRNGAEFLNQTTLKELDESINRIDPKIIDQSMKNQK